MLTSEEIAAFLGVTPGYVRRVIAERRITAAGRRGRAHLYWVDDVTRHTGVHDRATQSSDLR